MDRDRREAKRLIKGLSPKEKIKHFWYYYKWHTIACLLVVIVIVYSCVQCAMRVDYDLNISCYTKNFIDEEKIEKFEKVLEGVVQDINHNDSVDVYVAPYSADITGKVVDQIAQAVYQKISMEIAADDIQLYLFDQSFLDWFNQVYGDTVQSVTEISSISEIKDLLGLRDDEKLYCVTKEFFERSENNEEKVAQHNNAELVEQFFNNKIKKGIE